jgi:endoglucanase
VNDCCVAWSGYGLVRGIGWMPDIFTQSLGSVPTSDWNYKNWIPHVVVVNLGTNDQLGLGPPQAHKSQFVDTYITFVRNITRLYSDSSSGVNVVPQFFLACGPMTDVYCPHVHEVIDVLAKQDSFNIIFLDQRDVPNDCCGHPSADSSVLLARRGAETIRKAMKWV